MQPHKCPVCNGKGHVTAGFYNTNGIGTSVNTAEETCRSCDGKGVIWGPSESPSANWPWVDIFKNIPNTGIMNTTRDPNTPRPSGEPEENTNIHY